MSSEIQRNDPPPTAQQASFLDALCNTTSNLALVARAGCGKTSTILLGVDAYTHFFPRAEIIVCAYNKAIAKEVKDKLIARGHTDWRRVSATTIHSLGYGLLKFVFKSKIEGDEEDPTVPANKVRHLVDKMKNDKTLPDDVIQCFAEYGKAITQLVRLGKQAGVGAFPDMDIDDIAVWQELADHFDVDGLEEVNDMSMIISCAKTIYRQSLSWTQVIDFDDMILFPLYRNLRVKFGKDLIFLDEAQDLSRARQELALKFLKPGGKMVIVGDDRQAIYGFSGADASALQNMVTRLNAVKMPLSITWRCPKTVVAKAQTIVPDIQAAPPAIDGEVIYIDEFPKDLAPGDAILCRNTAPLVKQAYKLIRQGKSAKVEGRAIGDSLIILSQRWKIATIDKLMVRLQEFKDDEMKKAMEKGLESKAEEIADSVGTLMEICIACIEKGKTRTEDVKMAIANLFVDSVEGSIILATYHRSKGREWPRVFLFEHQQRCPAKGAKQAWQRLQEDNLAYVAFTRAQRTLAFVR